MVTLEDAVDALNRLAASADVDVIQDFFEQMISKLAPVDIPTDADGFIIEGAMQQGFDRVDDEAALYVVGAQDLIDYTKRQRGTP